MTTPAQLIAAARLVDKGWFQGNGWFSVADMGGKNCPLSAVRVVSGRPWRDSSVFEFDIVRHNDARNCTKDAAVMFLLLCAEARRCGDL